MTQLSRFLGLCACLYSLEHGVPHVHIYFGKPSRSKTHVIVIRIADGKIIAMGRQFPQNRVYHAMQWTFLRRQELLQAWEAYRHGKKPTKIAPLVVGEFSPLPRSTRYDNWAPRIRRLERLGNQRVRVYLDDRRVFERSNYAHADTARLVDGGHAVKRNRADQIYESARRF